MDAHFETITYNVINQFLERVSSSSVVDKETNDLLTQLGVESNNNPVVKKGFSKTLKKMFPDEFLFDDYFSTDDLARFARNQGYGSAKFNDIVDIGSSGMMVMVYLQGQP